MKFPSFFKKEKPVDFSTATDIVVIYNVVNDASMLSACLYAMAVRATGRVVKLMDIRDNIPLDAECYIWIGNHDEESIRRYVQEEAVENNYVRNWALNIHKRSVFIQSVLNLERSFEKSLTGMAIQHFWNTFYDKDACYPYDVSSSNRIFSAYAMLSEKWFTNDMDETEVAVYLNALLYCYAGAAGSISLEFCELETNLSMKSDEVERILSVYQTLNKVMAQSCRERVIDKKQVIYITKLGPEVFPLTRRIILANRSFYHASEGSYGKLIFASA